MRCLHIKKTAKMLRRQLHQPLSMQCLFAFAVAFAFDFAFNFDFDSVYGLRVALCFIVSQIAVIVVVVVVAVVAFSLVAV